jgi:hypothetical protein
MTRAPRLLFATPLFALINACSLWNRIDACDHGQVSTTQSRVNVSGDGDEFVATPAAAADIGNGHVLVAFGSESIEKTAGLYPNTSVVRIAVFNVSTGDAITPCNERSTEETLSCIINPMTNACTPDPMSSMGTEEYAYSASVAPAPIDFVGQSAAALVAFTVSAGPGSQTTDIHMRFVRSDGCPLKSEFRARNSGTDQAASVAWSPKKQSVLLTLENARNVFAAWVSDDASLDVEPIAETDTFIQSPPSAAIAEDGSALVVWSEDEHGVRGILLDSDGKTTRGPAFDLGFPAKLYRNSAIRVSVTAGPGRYAVTADGSLTSTSEPRVYVREFSTNGKPLGAAREIDSAGQGAQSWPIASYVAPETLLTVWLSGGSTQTSGRLFDLSGTPRFNTVSCSEGSFFLDAQHDPVLGTSSVVMVGGSVWVFESTVPDREPVGSGVGLWTVPFHKLYPGKD